MTSATPYLSIAVAFASALIAAHILSRRDGWQSPSLALGLLFAVFALQALMLVLIIDGGRPIWTTVLRPALAMTIGPLVYLYFKGVVNQQHRYRRCDLLHFAPAVVAALQLKARIFLIDIDAMIIASFAAYAFAVCTIAMASADKFCNLGDRGKVVRQFAIGSAVLLAASVIGEIAVNADLASGGALKNSTPLFILTTSDVIIAAIMTLIALRAPSFFDWRSTIVNSGASRLKQHAHEFDVCVAAFEKLAATEDFFSSTELTVRNVAERLGVPQRRLSEAINGVYGESFSRRMNRLRVEEVKRLMRAYPKTPITQIMFDAGFRTKSSFNREFRAIEGCSPTEYRANTDA